MYSILRLLVIFLLQFTLWQNIGSKSLDPRIKDITYIINVRNNILLGYGLVVGLDGTGDGKVNFTQISLASMLERLGVKNSNIANLDSKNVAAVIVTATLPAFPRQGTTIDVSVASLGACKSLNGGILLVTPLYAADGSVYAVAQGAITSTGISANAQAQGGNSNARANITKGVPTTGKIIAGAIIEKEIDDFKFNNCKEISLALRNPDFTTAVRVASHINQFLGKEAAKAIDNVSINIKIPQQHLSDPIKFITLIENLRVPVDSSAKVVVDEKDGVIVMTANVKVSSVALTHGSLTIKVTEGASDAPENTRNTLASNTAQAGVNITEEKNKFTLIPHNSTLEELVTGLNALGCSPRDLITILNALKSSGAILAEIVCI